MTSLPLGWKSARLGDVVTAKSGNSKLIKGKLYDAPGPGRVPAYSASGQDVWCDSAEWEGPGVVLSAVGARCGKAFFADGSWTAIANTHVLRPGEGVDARFLWYRVNDERFWIRGGSAQPFVKMKASLEREVLMPPLAEQQRIVAAVEEHLSNLETGAASLLLAEKNVRRLGRKVMHDAFAALEAWTTVGEVAEVQGGIQKQPKRRPTSNRFPFLRVANVLRNELILDEIHEIELFDNEIDRYRLEPGDLLVVEGNGSADQIGRAALWSGAIDNCVHQNHLIRVRPGPALDPHFLNWYWNSPSTADRLRVIASSTSGLYTLSTGKLKSLPVPVVPLAEQRAIAAKLDDMSRQLRHLEREIRNMTRRSSPLRRSVLAAAFAGRLVQTPLVEVDVRAGAASSSSRQEGGALV